MAIIQYLMTVNRHFFNFLNPNKKLSAFHPWLVYNLWRSLLHVSYTTMSVVLNFNNYFSLCAHLQMAEWAWLDHRLTRLADSDAQQALWTVADAWRTYDDGEGGGRRGKEGEDGSPAGPRRAQAQPPCSLAPYKGGALGAELCLLLRKRGSWSWQWTVTQEDTRITHTLLFCSPLSLLKSQVSTRAEDPAV